MRRAFTLIELLVVVAIIALLIAILLPSLQRAKEQARTDVCMSNMRQVSMGFLMYANEWNGVLPGSTWDWVPSRNQNPTYRTAKPLCWLGSLNGSGDRAHMPSHGTIFDYVGRNEKVYKCPTDNQDRLAEHEQQTVDKPLYSYTAPVVLSGAPLSLLRRTWWPDNFDVFSYARDWDKSTNHSQPWMLIEEHEGFWLSFVTDSAWSNVDELTERHRGRAAVAHTDGSVTVRKYQRRGRSFNTLDAWKVYYELADGRWVTAGRWVMGGNTHPRFGYMRTAARINRPR